MCKQYVPAETEPELSEEKFRPVTETSMHHSLRAAAMAAPTSIPQALPSNFMESTYVT